MPGLKNGDVRNMNLAGGLSKRAAEQARRLAVLRGSGTITCRQLDRLVWRLAKWLADRGIAPRDVVGLTFLDEVSHLSASLALIRIGAAQITLAPSEPVHVRNSIAD